MRVLAILLLVIGVATSDGFAQTPCAVPDDLCTGDPCIVGTLAVETPCVLDFGDRTLEIAGTVSIPDGGTLSLTAGTIRLLGQLDGRHVNDPGASGAAVTLVATLGAVELQGPIDVSGRATSGSIDVTAADLVTVGRPLRADGAGAGGTITLDGAAGVRNDAKMVANGLLGTGGAITLRSGVRVDVLQSVDVRGASGGSITVTGHPRVQLLGRLDARGRAGTGGSVTFSASSYALYAGIDVRAKGGDGGTVELSGAVATLFSKPVLASGSAGGGSISLAASSLDGFRFWRTKLIASGVSGDGGSLRISAPNGVLLLYKAKVDVQGALDGGLVQLESATLILQHPRVSARGKAGPGEIRMSHSSGNEIVVQGTFDARSSGVIELLAPAANLTPVAKFLAGPAGCVGLSAGTLDITGVRSDVPLAASCP